MSCTGKEVSSWTKTFASCLTTLRRKLEFLYLLVYRENEAQRDGEAQALASIARLCKRFLAEHLGRWVTPFTTAVRTGAQSAFYRELAELTDRVVAMEARRDFVQPGVSLHMQNPSKGTVGRRISRSSGLDQPLGSEEHVMNLRDHLVR